MNTVLQLLKVVTDATGDWDIRACAIIAQTRGWSLNALADLFEVALGSGLLSRAETTLLLQALMHLAASDDLLTRLGEPADLVNIRREVTALEQRRFELERRQKCTATLQTAVNQLEQTIHLAQEKAMLIRGEVSLLEDQRNRLKNMMEEVKS